MDIGFTEEVLLLSHISEMSLSISPINEPILVCLYLAEYISHDDPKYGHEIEKC